MSANIYYSPEKFGLTVVGEVEMSSGSYEFDTLVVWQDAQGQYVWAQDSGCSCPMPFEGVDLSNVNRGDAHQVAAAIKEEVWREDYRREYGEAGAVDLIARILG